MMVFMISPNGAALRPAFPDPSLTAPQRPLNSETLLARLSLGQASKISSTLWPLTFDQPVQLQS
jgi:hypothetical protein